VGARRGAETFVIPVNRDPCAQLLELVADVRGRVGSPRAAARKRSSGAARVHGRRVARNRGSAPPEVVLRVCIADDHPAILDALKQYIDDEHGVELVGAAADGEQALRLIERDKPDVAVLDIRMPQFGGIEVLRRLAGSAVAPPVILYTGYPERSLLLEALDVGARGFLLKESPLADLMRAIRIVAAGGTYIDPMLAGVLAGPGAAEHLPVLTARQREILRMLADGMRNEQVAQELSISPVTVKTHVKNAMERLEADTRTQAVATALRESLIT
jgi:DNA-binding NarL/FixJ family response regulator